MFPKGFKKIQCTIRVHSEIRQRFFGGPVVGGGGGGGNDEVKFDFLKNSVNCLFVSDIEIDRNEVRVFFLEQIVVPFGAGFFAEKISPHVIVDSHDQKSFFSEKSHRLR